MLVMAIEAAKQLSAQKTDRCITGYSFKDITFQKSLTVVPDFDGVEVEFHLRPIGQASDREITWSEYRLYVLENSEWAEVSRGSIRVNYEEAPAEVDNGLEFIKEIESYRRILLDGQKHLPEPTDIQSIYKVFEQSGLGFGPTFQTLRNGSSNDQGEAVAEIGLHSWLLKCNKGHQTPSVIHPTALDGLLQLSFLALSQGGEKSIPSLVPTRIHKLWISQVGLNDESIATIKAYNKSVFRGFREAESTVIALDTSESNIRVVIEGYEKVALGSKTKSDAPVMQRRLCFNFDHRQDVDLLDKESFVTYSQSISPALPPPTRFYRDMKLAMYLFLQQAFDMMPSLDRKGLKPHHQQYLRWMRHELDKRDAYNLANGHLDWRRYYADNELKNALFDRLESESKTGKFYVEVGRNMPKILSGEVDPLDLFFRTSLVGDYYREFNKTTNGLNSFLVYLDGLAHKRPGIRILEIGAGTGGLTNYVLKTLITYGDQESKVPRFGNYTYTDISPSFFEAARLMFADYEDRVTFKTLDIERDPISQGFDEEGYDLVIADNVLHATENLEVTLRNARRLLKPGGKIALFELTQPEQMKTNFAFGLLAGWWRFKDRYRDLSAGVTEKVWHEILVKAGFSGLDLDLPDYHDPETHEHSAMVSTAVAKYSALLVVPETLIVIDQNSSVQKDIGSRLQEAFARMGSPTVHFISLKEAASMQNLGQSFCISLLEAEHSLFQDIESDTFLAVRDIISKSGGVLWVTQGGGSTLPLPVHATINGLARTVKQENGKMKFVTIAFDPETLTASHFVETILRVFDSTIRTSVDDCEPEYVERNGRLCIGRFIEADHLNREIAGKVTNQETQTLPFGDCPPLTLTIASPGLMDTLEFVEDTGSNRPLSPDEIEIEVLASGVNFRDCLIALGRIPSTIMGFECAGVVRRVGEGCKDLKAGDRVCANAAGTYQTYARCKAVHAMPLPDTMSFVEGAALPVAFTTAYYALHHVARIKEGESILIHSGAGGTGQAAIQIAKLFSAEVYVTVGSEEKVQLLMDLYGIPKDHIFYSRDMSFAKGIKRMTRDKGGVDIVLNSLSGDALVNTWECMAPFGRFLEIGKKDILMNGSLPMFPFAKNVSFHAIDLNEARMHRPWLLKELKDGIVKLLFEAKIRPSQPLHVYGISEVEKAFRYLQSGKNTGKTVVEMRKDDHVKVRNLLYCVQDSFD